MNKLIPTILLFFFISGTFTTALTPVSASSELIENSWNTKTPMNHERTNFRVVTVDNKIYAIGGSYQTEVPSYDQWPLFVTNYLGTNERYDPLTDTWITLTSMPSPRAGFAIATVQGKIYCIGGVTGKSGMYSNLGINEVYDIATDSWSIKTSPMFNSEYWVQSQVVNEKIFVITGSSEDHKFGDLYMYDPQKDVWTEKASIPTNLTTKDYHLISTVIDDKLIVVSVVNPDYPYTGSGQMIVMCYNLQNDAWSEEKVGPEIKVGSGPRIVGTTTGIYAPKKAYFLGFDRTTASPLFWIYDPIKDAWSIGKAVESFEGDVAVVNDLLYVIISTKTMQYVPIGYRSTTYNTPTPTPSTSVVPSEPEPTDTSKTAFTHIIVTVLALTIGVVTTTGMFFYLSIRKRKNK